MSPMGAGRSVSGQSLMLWHMSLCSSFWQAGEQYRDCWHAPHRYVLGSSHISQRGYVVSILILVDGRYSIRVCGVLVFCVRKSVSVN
jgi:hypothetical protein